MALEKIDIDALDPARTIVVATGNLHKLTEIRDILSRVLPDVTFVALGQLGDFDDPEETGTTFLDNALIKAEAAVEATGLPAIADDSGLAVDALDGEPGVYEGCMPIEVMARRGADTMRYGPLRPVGLTNPATGRRPWANVQLRAENAAGTLYNLVGFSDEPEIWRAKARVLHDTGP